MLSETHPGLWQALMLMAPDDKVQEVGQVALAHVVPCGMSSQLTARMRMAHAPTPHLDQLV